MAGQFDVNSSLNQFRAEVEAQIRQGRYDTHGDRKELIERNGYIYSDLRASLMRRMKGKSKATADKKLMFAFADLEQIAETQGTHLKNVLHRAYVEVARAAK